MIQVRATLGDGTLGLRVELLTVDGHANHAASGAVCAAVSAITQTCLLGLQEVARQYPDVVWVDITDTEGASHDRTA